KGPGNYIAVGYYPKSLFGNGTLASNATKIAFGGEDTGSASAKQMGSGSLSADGWQKATYQNRAFFIDTSTVSQWANLTKFESNPDCYTATRSCPVAWCSWVRVHHIAGIGRICQLAIAGRLTVGSSPKGAMVSSVM